MDGYDPEKDERPRSPEMEGSLHTPAVLDPISEKSEKGTSHGSSLQGKSDGSEQGEDWEEREQWRQEDAETPETPLEKIPSELSDNAQDRGDGGSPVRPARPSLTMGHNNTTVSFVPTVRTLPASRGSQAANMPRLKRKYTKLANKEAHPMEHVGITLGLPMIVLFDIIVPCIIYYTWYDIHRARWQQNCKDWHSRNEPCPIAKPQFDKDILGYAVICFGFGELYILLARVWRLVFRREQCAPLLSRNRWELDATSWVYAVAMIMALVPFVVGSTMVIPELYLYGPAFLMAFLGVLMIVTTFAPFRIPIGINSHARGSDLRPFIYYAAEDFIAVDGLQDREFRIRYNERYESSKSFRRMFVWLTLWWELGVLTYIGCLSAVIWTLEFHIAFGLSLGVLFSYIAVWAGTSYLYVHFEMDRQRKAYEEGKSNV